MPRAVARAEMAAGVAWKGAWMGNLASMTGFARAAGADSGAAWVWELRSVNGRGLELRFKLPAGMDRLEAPLRAAAAARLARGTIQASLSLKSDEVGAVMVDQGLLAHLTADAMRLAAEIPGAPVPRVELLMALPGVVRHDNAEDATVVPEARSAAILADFAVAVEHLVAMRRAEGDRLGGILTAQLAQMADLRERAALAAAEQPRAQQARMALALDKLLNGLAPVPAERLAQEIALLAVRGDVMEELDRLGIHLAAAAGLIADGGPAGRQLDFLVQELLRETNTMCSKSASAGLTSIGLQMKGIIEQIREQVQNIE